MKPSFASAINIISNKITEDSVLDFTAATNVLDEKEKSTIFICLNLVFRPQLTNISFQIVKKFVDNDKKLVLEDFILNNLSTFCEYLPYICQINKKYYNKLVEQLIQVTPKGKIGVIVVEFKKSELLKLSNNVRAQFVLLSGDLGLQDFLNEEKDRSVLNSVIARVLKNEKCVKFSSKNIAKLVSMFTDKTLDIESKAFDAFCFYFTRKYRPFSFNVKQEVSLKFISFTLCIFATIPEVKRIIISQLQEKMKTKALNDIEYGLAIHALEDSELIDVCINAIRNKRFVPLVKNLSMRCKEKPLYQESFNIILPYVITTAPLGESTASLITQNVSKLTRVAYTQFALNKALDWRRKDIITEYALHSDVATSLILMIKLCDINKNWTLKPIEISFEMQPGKSFTGLYLLANSRYISDVKAFKHAIKAITKSCITPTFNKLVEGYNFTSRIKKFFKNKFNGPKSVRKFLLKVYKRKSKFELSEERIVNHLLNYTGRGVQKKVKIEVPPKVEKKPEEPAAGGPKLEETTAEERGSWSIFGFLSRFSTPRSDQSQESIPVENLPKDEDDEPKLEELPQVPEKANAGRARTMSVGPNTKGDAQKPVKVPAASRFTVSMSPGKLEVPSDDSISSDPELDRLSDYSDSYNETYSSESLGDLNSQWAM